MLPIPRFRLRLPLPHPLTLPSLIPLLPHRHRALHTSPRTSISHYETLQISPHASASEIKTAFYRLSKLHHPDHNPTDPHASKRFISISTAYSILSHPESRRTYDREHRIHSHHAASHPSSQARPQSHGGSRPATGLSRRKVQPKGPPPSYYSHGPGSEAWRAGPQGGQGRGEFAGWTEEMLRDMDIPHYNQEAKRKQHAEYEARWEERRTRRRGDPEESVVDLGELIKALSVVGILGITVWSMTLMKEEGEEKKQIVEKRK